MDTQAAHLLAEALKLPADTREDLAVRLMGTVELTEDQAAEVKQAWLKEIDRRVANFESSSSSGIRIEDAWPKITGKAWRSQAEGDA